MDNIVREHVMCAVWWTAAYSRYSARVLLLLVLESFVYNGCPVQILSCCWGVTGARAEITASELITTYLLFSAKEAMNNQCGAVEDLLSD